MSKTNWSDGSYITPLFMNSYIGTSAATGHNHQSLDATDSAPKINITGAAEVWGELPIVNMADGTSGPIVMRVEPPFATSNTDFTCSFQRIGDVVTVTMPIGVLAISEDNDQFRIAPGDGTWPTEIVPTYAKFPLLWAVKETDSADVWRTGALAIGPDATSSWIGYIDSTSHLVNDDWGYAGSGASKKGFLGGSFTYGV